MSPKSSRRRPPRPVARSTSNAGAAAASARARLAAERQAAARRRRRLLLVLVPVLAVVLVVAALVVVRATRGGAAQPAATAPVSADQGVVTKVTSVPAGVLDQVGAGSVKALPAAVTAPALTLDGKPLVLYVGAEYCPYCAAERWPMVVALSRFGTFKGLGQTASASDDVYPSTPTLSFHGSSFTSSTLAFTGVETESNQKVNGQYTQLDQLDAADQKTFSTYDSAPYTDSAGSIPFVDIGGRYLISGASYDPQLLAGKTHLQVATALSDPTSAIAKAVDGTANVITAAICASTKQAPAAVCTAAGVQAAAKQLS